jgi:hypothetical protein
MSLLQVLRAVMLVVAVLTLWWLVIGVRRRP